MKICFWLIGLFFKKEAGAPPILTDDEVAETLRTENCAVVQELYALILSMYNNEGDRTKALDAKAAALFGFVGAVVSAIFVVLGFLSDPKNSLLSSILSGLPLYALIIVLLSLTIALVALFRAVGVKKAWKAPGERDLFEAVQKYDGHGANDEKKSDQSANNYKRHLIEHFWKLYRVSQHLNELKAKALYCGQLFVFMGLVLLVGLQIYMILAIHGDLMSTPKNSGASPSAPTAPNTVSGPAPSERPPALESSSAGKSIRNSEDSRPKALTPSSRGTPTNDGADSTRKK